MGKGSQLHNIIIHGRRTSVRLEDAFWVALCDISNRSGRTVHQICSALDAERAGSLSSAVRVFVLEQMMADLAMAQNARMMAEPTLEDEAFNAQTPLVGRAPSVRN